MPIKYYKTRLMQYCARRGNVHAEWIGILSVESLAPHQPLVQGLSRQAEHASSNALIALGALQRLGD